MKKLDTNYSKFVWLPGKIFNDIQSFKQCQNNLECFDMRGEMNSYRFEISNRRENKFGSHEVSFRLHFKTTRYFWWTCVGISFRVKFTWYFYHPKWNFIPVKVTDMKTIPALSFKRTCALNTTSNGSAVIHFVSGKLCSRENPMPVWNFISVKLTDMNLYRFEFHFASFNVNTSKELDWTPKWDFQPKWNLIPVWVHFASHVNVLLI